MKSIWQTALDRRVFMKSFITVVIVGVVLVFLEKQTRKRERESEMTEEKFLIKLSSGYFFLGAIEAGMMGAILIWGELTNDLDIYTIIICVLVAIPGLMLMIGPLPGVWDILVNQDDITVTKCIIFKKNFQFSEITHCKHTRGGWKIYTERQKGKAFFVDRMADGAGLFLKRIEAANIPVEEMIRDK